MAYIEKRKRNDGKNSYRVLIRRKGHKTISGTFDTKRKAEAFAREVEGQIHKYAKLIGGETAHHTLAELIDRFMEHYAGRDRSLLPRLSWWRDQYGGRNLSEITRDTIQEGLERLRTEPRKQGGHKVTLTDGKRSPSTMNRYLGAISTVFTHAKKCGWMGVQLNPCRDIGRGKETHRFGRYLSDDERKALLEVCGNSGWAGLSVLVRLALVTGARRGELLKLTWADVDLERGQIHLRETKNNEPRTVPVIKDVMEHLKAWGKIRRLDSKFVFPHLSRNDRPYNIDAPWQEALTAAGIENFRFHDLRHSCASYLAQAGASPLQIGSILGHKSLSMVRRYSHLNTAETIELLEESLAAKFQG